MFESQLGLKENPFVAGHHPRFVYPSCEHQEALAHLRFGIENTEPFVLITGEVGTGKTTAIYDALSGWKDRAVVALINNSRLTRDELLEEICLRFGVLVAGGVSKPQSLIQLERLLIAIRARQDLAILLLDEAQNLERDQLEEIRLLSNLELDGQKLLQIFLVGQPELEVKLGRPELRQLRQRIGIHYRINPLSLEETKGYIHHRVTVAGGDAARLFPPETCAEIHRLTHGIPREINLVAGQSLITAFVGDSSSVRPQHVTAVAEDDAFHSVLDRRPEQAGAQTEPIPPPPYREPPRDGGADAPRRRSAMGPARDLPPEPPLPIAATPEPVAAHQVPAAPEPVAAHQVSATPEPIAVRPLAAAAPAERPLAPRPEPLTIPPPAPGPAVLAWRMEPASPPVRGGATPIPPVYTAPEPSQSTSTSDEIPRVAEGPKVNDQPKSPEGGEPPDVKMPAWLDEVLEKRKQVEAQVSADRPRVEGGGEETPSSAPPRPAAPPRTAAPDRIAPHPTDPKPAGYTPSPYISPRLRDKLMSTDTSTTDDDELEVKKGGGALVWVLGIGAIVAIAVVGFLVMRNNAEKPAAPAATQAPVEPVPTPTDSAALATTPAATGTTTPPAGATAAPHGATTAPTAAATTPPATTPKPAATPSATKPAGAAAGATAAAGAATAAAPAPPRKYGIEVGRFLNEERATSEKDRLATATGLEGRVLTAKEDGEDVWRVVLGSFDGRAPADKAANDLIGKGSVGQAVVVALPK